MAKQKHRKKPKLTKKHLPRVPERHGHPARAGRLIKSRRPRPKSQRPKFGGRGLPAPRVQTDATTNIKVIGIGGSGSNAVSRMMRCRLSGVELIAVNTDAQSLRYARAHRKIPIGKHLTFGLGSGMNPEIGRAAAEESRQEIADVLGVSGMIFITCGLGGGTGSGASPIVAEEAKKTGALTIAIVTKPFSFEGVQRTQVAEEGINNLKDKVDTLLVIPNDKLLGIVDQKTSLTNAFWICDEVLRQAVSGISDLIVLPGIINVDFADVKTIMENSGMALFGVGRAKGKNRAVEAAKRAISSSLLDISIEGAKGILFNVSGREDMTLTEINEAAKVITESADQNAKIIFGAVLDQRLRKNEIKITVIATGFNKNHQKNLKIFETAPKKPVPVEKELPPTAEELELEVPTFLRRKEKKE